MTVKKRVLIVEDDIWFGQYLFKIVQDAGYDAGLVSNAYEAMDYINSQLPDLVILDLLLPGVNGLALINELSSYTDTRRIPFIVCSSVSESIPKKNLEKYNIKKVLDKTSMEPGDVISSIKEIVL